MRTDSGAHVTSAAGKYQLLGRLAQGGMAELFLAQAVGPQGFRKLVVLKRIRPDHARDGRFVRMFLEEARLAAHLQHNHIAQVYDMGKLDGSYFFTMEYVRGRDVNQILRAVARTGAAVPLAHAIAIVSGAAAGLHYAHEQRTADGEPCGLVHRDVSPSNIMVGFDGAIKLLDFGIAKAAFSRSETRPGEIRGKMPYMSPEHFTGEPIDRRSDIFSLGIVLYELTTGTRLFDGKREGEIVHQIVYRDAPPPSSRVRDYPPALERVVHKALRRAPGERYATAQALLLELERVAERLPSSTAALSRFMQTLFAGEEQGAAIALGEDAEASAESRPTSVIAEPDAATDSLPQVLASPARPSRPRWRLPTAIAVALVGALIAAWALRRPAAPPVRAVAAPIAPAPIAAVTLEQPAVAPSVAEPATTAAAAPRRKVRHAASPRAPRATTAAAAAAAPAASWNPNSFYLPAR